MNMPAMQPERFVHFRFGWPIGMKLRLRAAPHFLDEYAHLAGCSVIVTGLACRHKYAGPLRQFVYLLQGRDERFSTERICVEDLELIPNIDPEAFRINQSVVEALPEWWHRHIEHRRNKQPGA